jgi:hypothetical protein
MYPEEIKGMMSSCQGLFNVFGTMLYLFVANKMQDGSHVFLAAAIIDAFVAIATFGLAALGLFGEK